MKNTKIINLFGPPCSGKSTTAAGLFYIMKSQSISCELVTEYAKDMVWRGLPLKAFEDQFYISAKQHHRLHRCFGKVDYIIMDSPLLLSLAYIPEKYFKTFKPFILEVFNSYSNHNFVLERIKQYVGTGRNQTKEQSIAIGERIKNVLEENNVDFQVIRGDGNAPKEIFKILDIW